MSDFNEDYTDTSTDMILVSSDGEHLHVNSYDLMSASSVFRDMLLPVQVIHAAGGAGEATTVELSDTVLEDADTLRAFLDFIHHRWAKVFATLQIGPTRRELTACYVRAVRLLDKYDCTAARANFELMLPTHIKKSCSPLRYFLLGANLNNVEICARSIRYARVWAWKGEPGTGMNELHQDIAGASVFDVSAMSSEWSSLMPLDYRLGLQRACRTVDMPEVINKQNKPDWDDVAAKFVEIMEKRPDARKRKTRDF